MSDAAHIKAVLDGYRTSVYTKDVPAFMSLYDEDVRVFDMWERWSYRGASQWREMATGWFGSLGTDRAAVEFHDVHITEGTDMALVEAFLTFRGVAADGKELRSMNNRLTMVLRKTDNGEWKVVHEHTSAPADFDTGKVNLHR